MYIVPNGISDASAIVTVSGTFLALSTLSLIGRIWVRQWQKARYLTDDWCMVAAWLAFVGLCASLIAATRVHTIGYTSQQSAALKANFVVGGKIQISINVFAALSLGLSKTSALFFFKRIFCVTDVRSTFRTVLNCCIIVVAIWTVTYFIFSIALCGDHIEGFWMQVEFSKYCVKAGHPYLLSGSVTDVVLELLIIALPMPKIWMLQTSLQRRLAVMLVFATALLSLCSSAARLAILGHLYAGDTDQPTKANSAIFFMWALEAGSAIIAVNLPSLWYVRTRLAPERLLRSFRSMISVRSASSRVSSSSGVAADGKTKGAKPAREASTTTTADELPTRLSADDSDESPGRLEQGWSGRPGLSGVKNCATVEVVSCDSHSRDTISRDDNIRVTSEFSQIVEKV